MDLNTTKLSQLVMELYANPELKHRFMTDPGNVFKEKGFDIPGDTEIRVVEDTKKTKHLVLPYLEPGEKLTPEVLEARLTKSQPFMIC